jgi:hypothetical protein
VDAPGCRRARFYGVAARWGTLPQTLIAAGVAARRVDGKLRRLLIVSSEEAILTHQYRSNISPPRVAVRLAGAF